MADSSMDNDLLPSRHDPPKEMCADNSSNTVSDILEPIQALETLGNQSEAKPAGPSWNDPPMVKFYEERGNISSGNLKHIKRVVKPGADSDSSKSELPAASIQDDEKSSSINPDLVPDDEKKNLVVDTFKNILFQPSWDEQKNIKDIEKRLHLLEQSWENLSSDVKQNMYKLALELTRGNIDKALKIHCHLMVQHVREVKNWMVAIKHLIGMKKELLDKEALNLSSTDNNR